MVLEFFDAAADFLAVASDWLATDPIRNTVVTTVAQRLRDQPPPPDRPFWFMVVRDDAGRVVGAGMRTAPSAPYRAYLLEMPAGAAAELADVLTARGEVMAAINGDLAASVEYADRWALVHGGRVHIDIRTRQFKAASIEVPPAPATGRLRVAHPEHADLITRWHVDFTIDAELQAGRPVEDEGIHVLPTLDEVRQRIASGGVWLWEDEDGQPVHFTMVSDPAFGVCRIGPVYTPAEHRGRGIAGYVVAVLSRRVLDQGHRVCLFTDQENAVSNALYRRMGYESLGDSVELHVEP